MNGSFLLTADTKKASVINANKRACSNICIRKVRAPAAPAGGAGPGERLAQHYPLRVTALLHLWQHGHIHGPSTECGGGYLLMLTALLSPLYPGNGRRAGIMRGMPQRGSEKLAV